jgi:hypothetical protein
LQNINDPLVFPGYFFQPPQPLIVFSQVAINNLIQIDEIQNTATFDFYFRLYWTDPRLSMPALWDTLNVINPDIASAGVDISQVVGIPDVGLINSQPSIWMPDIFFPEAATQEVNSQLIRLHPYGSLEWSRHFVITLIQSNFVYEKYPLDEQFIMLRYFSYGLNSSFLVQEFVNNNPSNAIVEFKSFSGAASISTNPIWAYQPYPTSYGTVVLETNKPNKVRSTVHDYVYIKRQPNGILLRLALPILLLVVLGSLTFWSALESRIDSTIALLLAVSALYIVIFQSVPMLGYLTIFDIFVLTMFVILFACCVTHQVITRLATTRKENPTRDLMVCLTEAFMRLMLAPTIIAIYMVIFSQVYSTNTLIIIAVLLFLFIVFVGYREYTELRKSYLLIKDLLNKKMFILNGFEKASRMDVFIFNVYYFNKFNSNTEDIRNASSNAVNVIKNNKNCLLDKDIENNNNDSKINNNEVTNETDSNSYRNSDNNVYFIPVNPLKKKNSNLNKVYSGTNLNENECKDILNNNEPIQPSVVNTEKLNSNTHVYFI